MSLPLRVVAVLAVVALPLAASAQTRGVVVDQTGLPLPGAIVQLMNGTAIVATVTSGPDGSFGFDSALAGASVAVRLDGFEPAQVARADAARITLVIAHTNETTTVVAPIGLAPSPTAAALGNSLSATAVSRLPSSHLKARDSLPLLPSVLRGPDGLMQIGGAHAHESPLLLDGFKVTDPSTGLSSLNLPFEAVRGVDVMRDPMAVTYGGLIAGVMTIESQRGSDEFKWGVQGIVPRPRFTQPGFGRIEGIFPRVYMSGSADDHRWRYLAEGEYDYERIPVPGITSGRGPDIVEESGTIFGRVDGKLSERHSLTVEGVVYPNVTRSQGLSPRRWDEATSDVGGRDLFGGVIERFVPDARSVLTIQVGAFAHDGTLRRNGGGLSLLSPAGWRGNWFAAASRHAVRYTAVAAWERIKTIGGHTHDVTISGEAGWRKLSGWVDEASLRVQDVDGDIVRAVDFGPPATIGARDRSGALAARDVWRLNSRLTVDAGGRLDASRNTGARPSARAGVRFGLDESGATALKAGYGSFIGTLPLGALAFGGYPSRLDTRFDPDTGDVTSAAMLRPTIGRIRLPRAVALTASLERQFGAGLDAQVSFVDRRSTDLATLKVPRVSGPLMVESRGGGRYREVQVSIRRSWSGDQQVFASYVRSFGRGELNDFSALFSGIDTPLLQPGGMSRLASDAPHRVLVWGTFNLPRRIVVSPTTEWRSGFPYSVLDGRYLYADVPNNRVFPMFLATDLVVYKTITVKKKPVDIGMQLFNVTNHTNPRDVYPVTQTPRFGQFTNSMGPVVRGYMLVRW
jgi:hypothetical protein